MYDSHLNVDSHTNRVGKRGKEKAGALGAPAF